MATLTVYSADSSALIHGWRRIYRPKNFGFVWDRLGVLIEEGRFKASVEVYHDLEKKDDELFKWCKDRKDKLVIDIDDNIQAHVSRIVKAYPRLVDTVKGRSGSDPFVIALAASVDPTMTVVTEEFAGKVRIPDVCNAEKIDNCGLADLIERENWNFK
jgi:Domain of unknown function (DUF4411)